MCVRDDTLGTVAEYRGRCDLPLTPIPPVLEEELERGFSGVKVVKGDRDLVREDRTDLLGRDDGAPNDEPLLL